MRISGSGHSPDVQTEATMPHARRIRLLLLLLILPLVAGPAMAGDDNNGGHKLRARLNGFHEVPSVSTVASGDFKATIARDEQSIEYELTYSGLQGTVQQAHIHVAQRAVNGSIVIWLCGTTGVFLGPPGTPTCPQSGTVARTVTAADVVAGATASQQLAAGELNEVIAAIRAGVAYANVHTNLSTGGEIRGQIRTRDDH
jgi:CHRD domain